MREHTLFRPAAFYKQHVIYVISFVMSFAPGCVKLASKPGVSTLAVAHKQHTVHLHDTVSLASKPGVSALAVAHKQHTVHLLSNIKI